MMKNGRPTGDAPLGEVKTDDEQAFSHKNKYEFRTLKSNLPQNVDSAVVSDPIILTYFGAR